MMLNLRTLKIVINKSFLNIIDYYAKVEFINIKIYVENDFFIKYIKKDNIDKAFYSA